MTPLYRILARLALARAAAGSPRPGRALAWRRLAARLAGTGGAR